MNRKRITKKATLATRNKINMEVIESKWSEELTI